jgi:hypothetical protein
MFPFCENVFVPSKSPVKVQPELLDIFFFLADLYVVYTDRGGGKAHFSSCGECDMGRLGSISFYSPLFKDFWIPARLLCSFCEEMAG